MGQLDKQPDNRGVSDSQAAEAQLRAMTRDIENLRQNLLGQLSQDIERLQREKSQLIEEIETLQAQRQQQILQQQQLVRQIAPALVNQLQEIVTSRLNQLADSLRVSYQDAASSWEGQSPKRKASSSVPLTPTANDYNENVDRLIASLDSTLRATFRTLQQDLKSYQSSLSQQLAQMYSMEKQGEAILEALVNRLKKEIQTESSAIQNTPLPPPPAWANPPFPHPDTLGYPDEDYYPNSSPVSYAPDPAEPSAPVVPPTPQPEPQTQTAVSQPQPASKRKSGLVLVLLSSLLLAFQNVIITVIFNKSPIFGLFELGGFVAPSLGNSLLVLWLRMLFVVPLMAILATVLYPSLWRDIKQFAQSNDWLLFFNVLGSGFFLFLSQALIYLALGSISPGVAITIFFIYPSFTMLLAWVLYGVRPTLINILVIFSVLVGFVLITLPGSRTSELSSLGVSAAAGAGVAFALYVLLSQTSAKKIKPIPLSWMNFVIILAFSGLGLTGPFSESWRFDVAPTMWPGLIVSTLVLAGTTLLSYFLNNLGLRRIDAARASILGATVPALTALLALVMIQSSLRVDQVFGMVLVTLGVAALSFERWRRHAKATQSASRNVK